MDQIHVRSTALLLTFFVCPSKVGGKLYAKEKSQEVAEIAVKHLKSGQTVDKVKSIVAPRQGMLRHSSLY